MATSERSLPPASRPGDSGVAVALDAANGKPVLEVAGGRGRLSTESFRELWHFREVLFAFLVRQLKVRYKQAAVGIAWAVVQPLVAALIFALFLGRYANVPSDGHPYLLFVLAGTAVWTAFSGAAATGSESLVSNQSLLRKIYFPREVLPLSAVGAALVDLACALAVVVAATAVYGIVPALAWLALPLPLLVVLATAGAFALALSAVNVYYRDVRYTLPFVLQIGLFASPVVYPLSAVPEAWRDWYAVLNPLAAAIDGVRGILLEGEWPNLTLTGAALAWSLALLVAAYAFFKRLERGFADRV